MNKIFNNDNIFTISINEDNKNFTSYDVKNLLQIIKKNKPSIIIINSQNSSSSTKNHFQHIFSEKILKIKNDKLNYEILYKKGISNNKSKLYKFFSPLKKVINLRTRIYFNKNEISSINLLSERIEENYLTCTLKFNGNYEIKNINFSLDESDHNKNLNILQEIKNTNKDTNLFLSLYYKDDNFKPINSNNASNSKNKMIQILNKNIIDFNSLLNNNNNFMNALVRKLKQSSSQYSEYILKKISPQEKINIQNGGEFFSSKKDNGDNTIFCISLKNREKLGNLLSKSNNIPNNSTDIGFYQIIEQLKISGININILNCLLNGIYEGHNKKNTSMHLIYFLYQFIDYINYLIQKKTSNSKNITILNNIKKLIKIILNEHFKKFNNTRIITNCTNSKYLDITNSYQYLLILQQPFNGLKQIFIPNKRNTTSNDSSIANVTTTHSVPNSNVKSNVITNTNATTNADGNANINTTTPYKNKNSNKNNSNKNSKNNSNKNSNSNNNNSNSNSNNNMRKTILERPLNLPRAESNNNNKLKKLLENAGYLHPSN